MNPYELALFDPAPVSFDTLNLDTRLLSGIKDLGWSDTRSVQSGVIPLALTGADVIACAETGTGKTAAFLVPILQRFLNEPAPVPPRTRALVLAPTRELAVQIEDQVQGLTYHTTVSSIAVYGGVPMDQQERALKAHVDMVVATPGRLMDHMRHDTPSFSGLEVLVLDEADRMLDMGFWPDVQRILAALPAKRQTLLFSATMPAEVLKLTQEFLRDPKYVQVGRSGGPAQTITHAVREVPSAEKTKWLAQWLREESEGPGADLLPDQDRRRSPGDAPVGHGDSRCRAARRSDAAAAHGRGGRVPHRHLPGAGGHRRGRPRAGHRRHCPRGEFRSARHAGSLRASRGPHRPV